MKKYILGLVVLVALSGCGTKEKVAMQNKIDSLTVQLTASQEAERNMNEVGMLIDSIDASRKSLQMELIEGNTYADYLTRLREINAYVQQTEEKLERLEKSGKNNSKASASSIRRLKADLEKRTVEITELQLQIANLRDENLAVWTKVNQKDSLLSTKDQLIKLNQDDIASLEKMFNDTQAENKTTVGNLYFAQAAALEKAANRTHFAPRKKKDTRSEALELYKLSRSMGNTDAQERINELEKKLS
jgi:chromosome segregation ATPase